MDAAPMATVVPRRPAADRPDESHAGVRWLNRVAAVCTLPIARELQTVARWDAVRRHRVWTDPPLDAGGLPVLLVGGLATSAAQLGTLAEWLTRLGCRVRVAAIGDGRSGAQRRAGGPAGGLSAPTGRGAVSPACPSGPGSAAPASARPASSGSRADRAGRPSRRP